MILKKITEPTRIVLDDINKTAVDIKPGNLVTCKSALCRAEIYSGWMPVAINGRNVKKISQLPDGRWVDHHIDCPDRDKFRY